MKVRCDWTEDVPDEFRRAINRYQERPGLATRQEVKDWFWLYGQSMNDDLMDLYDDEDETVFWQH